MPAIGPSFRIAGIEPADVRSAPREVRQEFWDAVLVFALEAKDRELARGLDRYGRPMAALKRSTIRNRRSAMGPADPGAPPLQPAHGLSRTRSLLTGQATPSGVVCWWEFDSHVQSSWGEILKLHREGSGRLPRRDVIGLSPVSKAEVARRARDWWRKYLAGQAGRPELVREPRPAGEKPKFLVEPQLAPKPRRGVSELRVNDHHYTFQSGSAAQVREMIANKSFSGWMTGAEIRVRQEARGITRKADGSVDWEAYFARNRRSGGGPPPRPPASPTAPLFPRRPRPSTPAAARPPVFASAAPDYSRKPRRPKPTAPIIPTPPAPPPPPEPTAPAFPASNATVRWGGWDDAERKQSSDAAARALGEAVVERIASIVGAPDDAVVTIHSGFGRSIQYEISHPKLVQCLGAIERRITGELIHKPEYLKVRESEQGRGFGTRIHGRRVYWGAEAGVEEIRISAGRGDDMTGYAVWPVVGYDGPLPEKILDKLPDEFRAAKTVQELLAIPGGAEWWEKNGDTMGMTFDLRPRSRSVYLWTRHWEKKPRATTDE